MFFDSLFFVVVFILLNIFVMVGVAFLTLLERSVLDYIHIRKCSNSVGFVGVLQPFYDAISVFTKEQYFPFSSNVLSYNFSPVFGFSSPYNFLYYSHILEVLFLLFCF